MIIYDPVKNFEGTNFFHREVSRSSTANRHEIDNTPSTLILERAELLAQNILQPVRDHYGQSFTPSSWFRCEELEKIITAVSFKNWCKKKGYNYADPATWRKYFDRKSHPRGEAADIEIPGIENDKLYDWILNNLDFDQLIREFPKEGDPMSGWVHVSYRVNGNRRQSFTIG